MVSRREFLKSAAVAAGGLLTNPLSAEESLPPKSREGYRLEKKLEDKRKVLTIHDPGEGGSVRLVIEGNQAVVHVRKKGENPLTPARENNIDPKRDRIIEFDGPTKITYLGTDPKRPLQVALRSNNGKEVLSQIDDEYREVKPSHADLLFTGKGNQTHIEFDMTREHGQWGKSPPTNVQFGGDMTPTIVTTTHIGSSIFKYGTKTELPNSEAEFIPTAGDGVPGNIRLAWEEDRNFTIRLVARSQDKNIAQVEFAPDCHAAKQYVEQLNGLVEKVHRHAAKNAPEEEASGEEEEPSGKHDPGVQTRANPSARTTVASALKSEKNRIIF